MFMCGVLLQHKPSPFSLTHNSIFGISTNFSGSGKSLLEEMFEVVLSGREEKLEFRCIFFRLGRRCP